MKKKSEIQTRLEMIKHMLMELSLGNFSYKIPASNEEDEIESIILLMNMMAEEIRGLGFHQNPRDNFQHKAEMIFFLDEKQIISNLNRAVSEILQFPKKRLIGTPFANLIQSKNQKEWEELTNKKSLISKIIQLEFISKSGLGIPAFCTFSTMISKTSKVSGIVTSLQTVINHDLLSKNRKTNIINTRSMVLKNNQTLQLESDIKKIREVHQFILNNLDRSLPRIREIAKEFHLNEYKLKKGFKEIYNTTIFRFHLDERLKQAYILIENSPMPLKTVAYTNGFKSFPHFSQAFKKKYGFSPKKLQKGQI